jgi:urease accessory protein
MKLSLNTDFTRLPRAGAVVRADARGGEAPTGRITLAHDERHLRRKVLTLEGGGKLLVDLAEPMALDSGDLLALDDGGFVEIGAADEDVYDIRPHDAVHLAELAWHIGNRHLAAEITADRIVIQRDHVIKAMLEGLGATVTEIVAPFSPVRGAYSGGHLHGHGPQPDAYGRMPGDPHYGHSHGPGEHLGHHGHDHEGHDHGELDSFGRKPGDPHYGHNHA